MAEFLIGCSGWNYPDTPEKGGWTGIFYPDKDTKRLRYYPVDHYGGAAVINAMQFKAMNGISLSKEEENIIERAETYNIGGNLFFSSRNQ